MNANSSDLWLALCCDVADSCAWKLIVFFWPCGVYGLITHTSTGSDLLPISPAASALNIILFVYSCKRRKLRVFSIPDFGRWPDAGSAFYCANGQNERNEQTKSKSYKSHGRGRFKERPFAHPPTLKIPQRINGKLNQMPSHKDTCRLEKKSPMNQSNVAVFRRLLAEVFVNCLKFDEKSTKNRKWMKFAPEILQHLQIIKIYSLKSQCQSSVAKSAIFKGNLAPNLIPSNFIPFSGNNLKNS